MKYEIDFKPPENKDLKASLEDSSWNFPRLIGSVTLCIGLAIMLFLWSDFGIEKFAVEFSLFVMAALSVFLGVVLLLMSLTINFDVQDLEIKKLEK